MAIDWLAATVVSVVASEPAANGRTANEAKKVRRLLLPAEEQALAESSGWGWFVAFINRSLVKTEGRMNLKGSVSDAIADFH